MGATAEGKVLDVPVWIILKPVRVGTILAVEGQKFELVVTERLNSEMNMFDPIKMGIKGEYNE